VQDRDFCGCERWFGTIRFIRKIVCSRLVSGERLSVRAAAEVVILQSAFSLYQPWLAINQFYSPPARGT